MKYSINLIEVVSGDKGTIYSIQYSGSKMDELEVTLNSLKTIESGTYNLIVSLLDRMVCKKGFDELHFNLNVGKRTDKVCRLDVGGSDFRLYCIRINSSLIIIGGGGMKLTRTYQETESTDKAVKILQAIYSIFDTRLESGELKIVGDKIEGNKKFEIEIEV